ncbi:uncharacterized protein EKO05_0009324 [Ascochyta rabiei]|uniref:Uncharacterized protein n=1 Tax=Didymella rabiei TaxID=5454 RepID=A0A163EUK0_DIDRA|nr:uncharacterized protein EKO05_0009324 [Ascochyta rabiei]KZM23931.1 hypothetical protein ST47_g4899 [Ascochyta rabiei]UPX19048.1 hypothetical protein EKO05_0009324 [Ascochyta rabiei]
MNAVPGPSQSGTSLHSKPCVFFDASQGVHWGEGTDPLLQAMTTLNDAPKWLLPSLTVNVSHPDALLTWINTNNAALITELFIYCPATDDAPTTHAWCQLFDKLSREATNIQDLQVYWDWDHESTAPTMPGLGKSLTFVRALGALRVKGNLTICGFYAKHWPMYLSSRIGTPPYNPQIGNGSEWEMTLERYQVGTEGLIP